MVIILLAWKLGKNQGLNLYLQFQVSASEGDHATNQKLSDVLKSSDRVLPSAIAKSSRRTRLKGWLTLRRAWMNVCAHPAASRYALISSCYLSPWEPQCSFQPGPPTKAKIPLSESAARNHTTSLVQVSAHAFAEKHLTNIEGQPLLVGKEEAHC